MLYCFSDCDIKVSNRGFDHFCEIYTGSIHKSFFEINDVIMVSLMEHAVAIFLRGVPTAIQISFDEEKDALRCYNILCKLVKSN